VEKCRCLFIYEIIILSLNSLGFTLVAKEVFNLKSAKQVSYILCKEFQKLSLL
jgi:hypothetical protein